MRNQWRDTVHPRCYHWHCCWTLHLWGYDNVKSVKGHCPPQMLPLTLLLDTRVYLYFHLPPGNFSSETNHWLPPEEAVELNSNATMLNNHTTCPQFSATQLSHTTCTQFSATLLSHTTCPQFSATLLSHTTARTHTYVHLGTLLKNFALSKQHLREKTAARATTEWKRVKWNPLWRSHSLAIH